MTSSSLSGIWFQLLALLAVEVGLIALAVAIVQRWSRSATWRRTLCQAGIIAVLLVAACELSGSARLLAGWAADAITRPQEGPALSVAGGPAPEIRNPKSEGQPKSEIRRPAGFDSATARAEAARNSEPSPRNTIAKTDGHGLRSTTSPSTPTARGTDPVSDSLAVLWICLLWVAGALLVSARACLARFLFVVFRLRRRTVEDPALLRRVEGLARALGIRRRVRVVESARLTGPIAFGLVQPTVGLPPDFGVRFESAKQDAMLAHELAHLAAHDPFWCLLADAATAILWWHPGVWWLRAQLHLAGEMAADEASLLVADGPRVLAECLVELGSRLVHGPLLGQLRVSGFRSHLGRRVHRLVHLERGAGGPPRRLWAALIRTLGPIAMVGVVILCTAWAAPQALMKGNSMKTMQMNWKRSLATFALLAAFHGPQATVAVAQSDTPPLIPSATPAAPPAPVAVQAPATPANPGLQPGDAEAFRRRYGLPGVQPPGAVVPPAPVPSPGQAEPAPRGAKVEAKLKGIVLDEVSFDGLPLGEVLRYLSDEALKRDPEKTGVNFLINPNFPPVGMTGTVDPTTGLPVAAASESFDMSAVLVRFNLPLRHVTMKDVLDAIVKVADHPIEYSLEDYAVIFSARPETVGGQPVVVAPRTAMVSEPAATPRADITPMAEEPADASKAEAKFSGEDRKPKAELANVRPQTFNIDFGPAKTDQSKQTGPAAAGRRGDYWNTVSITFNSEHSESGLKFANGDPSPIEADLINLGGSWGNGGEMGLKSPMLDTFNYPVNNQGGNSTVVLHHVPAGKYQVYIYGHGTSDLYYGDYTLSVGGHGYGRKTTTHKNDAVRNTKWVEGSQYVKFSNVKVGPGDDVEILIQPGGQVSDPLGRTFADAMISGLQLIPVK